MATSSIWRDLAEIGAVVSGSGTGLFRAAETLVGEVLAIGEPVAELRH